MSDTAAVVFVAKGLGGVDMEAVMGQRMLDFERAEQLALLRNACLPASVPCRDGGRVSATMLKSMLRTIDDHARGHECWARYTTLAAETGCSLRQAKRAIEALLVLSLLTCERRRTASGIVANHYRIVWSELALLARNQSAPGADQSAPGADQSATGADQSATGADQSAMVTRPKCHGGTPRSATRSALLPDPDPEAPGPDPVGPRASRAPMETITAGSEQPSDPWLDQYTELVEARGRTVKPLPLGQRMRSSVFHPLTERHLRSPRTMIEWHRRQLSHPSPVVGSSEMEAILVVAAGLYASRVSAQRIERSRVALFCGIVHRHAWRRVLRYVPEAADAYQRIKELRR